MDLPDYYQSVDVSGGTPGPLIYSIRREPLPIGLSLNSSTGLSAGTPTVAGTDTFVVEVTDATGIYVTQAYTVTILPAVSVGGSYDQTIIGNSTQENHCPGCQQPHEQHGFERQRQRYGLGHHCRCGHHCRDA